MYRNGENDIVSKISFKDEDLCSGLKKNGYAVLDVGMQYVDLLEQYISTNFSLPPDSFYYSLLSNSPSQNIDIRNTFHRILRPFYEENINNYRSLNESFLSKAPKTESELFLHQDWNYTDERVYDVYNLWIPLMDINETNGALFFLKGSHNWFNNIRSSTIPTARIATQGTSIQPYVETVFLKRGQALIFHPAVFHGSMPNYSGQHRTVVTATLMHHNAPFLYYDARDAGTVGVYRLDDDAFLDGLQSIATQNRPDYPLYQQIHYTFEKVYEKDLMVKAASAYDQ